MILENYIPECYDRIKVVGDLYAFLNEDFAPKANVVLYPRRLDLDFDALAYEMAYYFELGEQEIFLKYSEREQIEDFKETLVDEDLVDATNVILSDMDFLYSAGVKTHMRLLQTYTQHKATYGFHVDGLEQDFDRFMTCYNDPVTQFVKNDDVIKVSGHDAICRKGAEIYQFKVGDIWKARVRNKPQGKIDDLFGALFRKKENRAFVHRAQRSQNPRILVVGDKRC